MKQFEYRVVNLAQSAGNPLAPGGQYVNHEQRGENLRTMLDELGAQGWEMAGNDPEGRGIFKREKSE